MLLEALQSTKMSGKGHVNTFSGHGKISKNEKKTKNLVEIGVFQQFTAIF